MNQILPGQEPGDMDEAATLWFPPVELRKMQAQTRIENPLFATGQISWTASF